MILGNSNGKNKGKKYRSSKEVVDMVYALKAEDFNEWFSVSYNKLVAFLLNKNAFDNDTMTETYMKMYESILNTGLEIKDYKSYFFRAYYTNHINGKVKENRYCELLPNFDRQDSDTESLLDMYHRQKQLEDNVFGYIYENYELQEFEIFKMYVSLKPAVNYSTLSEMTGIKSHLIQRIVSKIKKDIRQNEAFVKQRQEAMEW